MVNVEARAARSLSDGKHNNKNKCPTLLTGFAFSGRIVAVPPSCHVGAHGIWWWCSGTCCTWIGYPCTAKLCLLYRVEPGYCGTYVKAKPVGARFGYPGTSKLRLIYPGKPGYVTAVHTSKLSYACHNGLVTPVPRSYA